MLRHQAVTQTSCNSRQHHHSKSRQQQNRAPGATRAAGRTDQMSAEPTSKPVSFSNSHGQKLAGIFTTSTKPNTEKRCIILCHGYASFKDGFHLPALAAALAEAGYNSLRFDFSGNGESEGHFKFANYTAEVGDVKAAKDYLEQQEGQKVVGLLGHSKGGDVVVLYARLHGDIPLVINVAGRFDLKEGIEQRFGADIFNRVLHEPVFLPAERDDGHTWTWHLTAEDLEERLSLDMAATAAAVKHVKVLTIHGTADKVIPVEDGRKFAAALPGNRLVIVEGADHNFRGNQEHLAQLKQAVLTFIEQEGFSLPSPRPDDSSSLASP